MPTKCERCGKKGFFETVMVMTYHRRFHHLAKIEDVGVDCCLKAHELTIKHVDNPKTPMPA